MFFARNAEIFWPAKIDTIGSSGFEYIIIIIIRIIIIIYYKYNYNIIL